jgi:hypothetical protein
MSGHTGDGPGDGSAPRIPNPPRSDRFIQRRPAAEIDVVTSLTAEASSFMTFTQPQILLCGASPDAARRTSPIPKETLPVSNDDLRRRAAEVPIPPTAQAAGPLGTH